MDIAQFADLLSAAKAQSEPQRLLFVFVAAELPEDATEAENNGMPSSRAVLCARCCVWTSCRPS